MRSLPEALAAFNEINLSDCRLVGVRLEQGENDPRDTLTLLLEMVAGEKADSYVPAYLRFVGCGAVRLHVDTFYKSVCSDNIAEVDALPFERTSGDVLLEQSAFREQHQPSYSLIMFTVTLCSPAGVIEVAARDFTLVETRS